MTNLYRLQDGGVLVIDKDGNIVKVAPNDASCIVPDGGRVSVPVMLMDGKSKDHSKAPVLDLATLRPREGIRSLEDRARVDAHRIKSEQRKADAWKNPATQEIDVMSGEIAYRRSVERIGTANPKKPDDWVEPEKAWDRMRKRTEEAWRSAKTKTPSM